MDNRIQIINLQFNCNKIDLKKLHKSEIAQIENDIEFDLRLEIIFNQGEIFRGVVNTLVDAYYDENNVLKWADIPI